MAKVRPCYRICIWDGKRWRPHVQRTRRLLWSLRSVLSIGWKRRDIHVERRPGKGIPMPLPPPKGSQLRLAAP